MTTLQYEAPTLAASTESYSENAAIPAFIVAAASVVGVSATFAAWVCDQCTETDCNSLWNTVDALRKWIATKDGC